MMKNAATPCILSSGAIKMQACLALGQTEQPRFSLLLPDRVHPNDNGAFVMAYHFLKAQGVRRDVAVIELDAATAKISGLPRPWRLA